MSSADDTFSTQNDLLNALALHFGLPPDRILIGSHIKGGEEKYAPLEAVFKVALIGDDLIAAVDILLGKENKQ